MAPIFANMSCDPFTASTAQCVVGAYVQYSVNASSVEDYQTTLAFVRTHNIRLVVRNTGHDYFGKSTGAGAIALWTHHLKDVSFLDYSSSTYQGKAMKIGAGVQNIEAQTAAHAQGLVVVGGDCQSVGIAGGYTQGGGHGPLASKLGLGADQVLEWELVTTAGDHLTASPTENPDLYWALSGGGGGTYGLVFSLTVRAYPDFQTAMANLTFSKNASDPDPFYQAVETFVTTLPAITDAGATAIWLLTSTVFSLSPMTGPGMTSEQLQALLQPTLDHLDTLGIAYGEWIWRVFFGLNEYHHAFLVEADKCDRSRDYRLADVSGQLPLASPVYDNGGQYRRSIDSTIYSGQQQFNCRPDQCHEVYHIQQRS